MRRHKPRISNLVAGSMAILVLAAACYLVFGGGLPFSGSPFVLKAMFTSQTELHIPSPVRIAGVDVGQVTAVQRMPNSDAAVLTMQIQPNGLPIHADATALIRARIFLEGNFYVALSPGSPSAAVLKTGDTLPASSTSGPVQLDRVLSSLDSNARANLQTLLQGLGATLDGRSTPAQDAQQDPIVRGLTGGQALNESLRYSAQAFRASTIVNEALLGQQPHDLSNVVVGNQEVFKGFARDTRALASLITTFNATMAGFAARQQDLSQTIAVLPALLRVTQSSDSALDASFAPTQQFAAAFTPGLKQLDPTIGAALPWIAQATALSSNTELGGLLRALTPAVQQTASSIGSTKDLVSQADLLGRCFSHNLVPAGNQVIKDPPVGTGLPVYREFFQSAVGLAGASGEFDGNGRYIRASAGGGSDQVQSSAVSGIGPLYGNAVLQPLGTRPAFAGSAPPIHRGLACYRNAVPDLNSASTGSAP